MQKHTGSYRFAFVPFVLRQNSGNDVFEKRQRSQKSQRNLDHLKEPELVEIPDIWEQEPGCEAQGCGQHQLPRGRSQKCVELFIKIREAHNS